jgi:hypothetical protein
MVSSDLDRVVVRGGEDRHGLTLLPPQGSGSVARQRAGETLALRDNAGLL